MKRLLPTRLAHPLVVATGLLIVVVSAAAAAANSRSVHACAKKSDGALRLASHCSRNEQSVSWNIRGPQGVRGPRGQQGLQGPKGAQGALGTTGDRGPSDAFTAYPQALNVGGGGQGASTVGTLTLPAGNFMVFGKASVDNGLDQSRAVTCGLGTPGINSSGSLSNATDQTHIELDAGAEQGISLLGPVQMLTTGDVTLDCDEMGTVTQNGNFTFTDIEVSAIAVASLHSP